jgi:hypothetical protein
MQTISMRGSLSMTAERYFYAAMSLVVTLIVVYGFSRTIGKSLLHPVKPPPAILYVHAIVFSSWLLLLLTQSTLVQTARVRVHRTLGYAGMVLGALMPVIAMMTKHAVLHSGVPPADDEYAFIAVTINDMLCFGTAFALAMNWRKKPEYHRRLILIASCCLTVAAFARFPSSLIVAPWWYVYVDALILFGVIRDALVMRRVHIVYRYALPALIACQAVAMYLFLAAPLPWVAAMRWLFA